MACPCLIFVTTKHQWARSNTDQEMAFTSSSACFVRCLAAGRPLFSEEWFHHPVSPFVESCRLWRSSLTARLAVAYTAWYQEQRFGKRLSKKHHARHRQWTISEARDLRRLPPISIGV